MKKNQEESDFTVVATGVAGIEDLRDVVDESKVWYGLMKVSIGSGNFQRTKNVFIWLNGEKCPAIKRSRATQMQDQAKKALGGHAHASVTFTAKQDVTFEEFWTQVGNIFVSDDLNVKGKKWNFEQEKKNYQKQMAKKKREKEINDLKSLEAMKKPKKMDKVTEILEIFREDMGWVNWVLFKPTAKGKPLKLYTDESYGDGSIYKMRLLLSKAQDKVLFGLLRMSFGIQPYRRTHYVMFHWVGEKTKILTRGKLNALTPDMVRKLSPFNITVKINRLEDLTVENIILRVKKIVTVDGDEKEGDDIAAILIKRFKEALAEEEKKNAKKTKVLKAEMQPKQVHGHGISYRSVHELVKLVENKQDDTNWVLLAPPGHERGGGKNPGGGKKRKKGPKLLKRHTVASPREAAKARRDIWN